MPETARIKHCLKIFKDCRTLAGQVAECGVAYGHLTFILDRFVLGTDKKLLAFDTFAGLPYNDTENLEDPCVKGEMDHGGNFFQVYDHLENTAIIPVKGLIETTLKLYENTRFCFVWIDLDVYPPTSYAYNFFKDRMVPGGVIGFHDYGFVRCPGVKKVVDNEVNYTNYKKILNEDTCFFIRRVKDV